MIDLARAEKILETKKSIPSGHIFCYLMEIQRRTLSSLARLKLHIDSI
jgi:hypothetical protein